MDAARVRYRDMVYDSARWEGFVFRPGDIVISTPAKCGTTWTQMICALLVFQTTSFDRSLDLISPWLEMLTRDRDSVFADLDAQTHRRFIKSHTPFDGLPHDPRVTYIAVGRDPRDVACSWDNHMANMDMMALFGARAAAVGLDDLAELLAEGPPAIPETEIERFWLWVDDDSPATAGGGLASVLHHLSTFWAVRDRANVVVLHYDDLKTDLDAQMRLLAEQLAISVPEHRWAELVEAATFEQMRAHADQIVPNATHQLWQSNTQFFNRGASGQWRDLLDAAGLRRYQERVAQLASPDLATWVHR
ncbi:MAG: aryl sulfotransferase [Actinomycetota bacterium]|nr:aryl sulfotransferase [Actinomycetota bacterium]